MPELKDYKACSDELFGRAMAHAKLKTPQEMETDELYVAYTKYAADARNVDSRRSPYAMGISMSSRKKADAMLHELRKRGVDVTV